jgi:hypothetical protein
MSNNGSVWRPTLSFFPASCSSLVRMLAALVWLAVSPLAVAREARFSVTEPARAETQLRCMSWRVHLTRIIDMQERYAVVTTALAQGLRAEIDRLEIRCGFERPQAVLDRYVAIDTFLSDETQEQLLINPAEFSCELQN